MSVTYEWINLTTESSSHFYGYQPHLIEFRGSMTFDDAAFAFGSLVTAHVPRSGRPEYMSYFGLEHYDNLGAEIGSRYVVDCPAPVDYGPLVSKQSPDCNLLGPRVIGGDIFDHLQLDMHIIFGEEYLTGNMAVGNDQGDFLAHSEGNLWQVDRMASDNFWWACESQYCQGITGYWQRDWTVSEPSTMIVGFALVALAIVYKLRRFL